MKKLFNPDRQLVPVRQALAEWDELTAPLRALGFTVHSFDPGVRFSSTVGQFVRGPEFSVTDLRVLNKALQR